MKIDESIIINDDPALMTDAQILACIEYVEALCSNSTQGQAGRLTFLGAKFDDEAHRRGIK